MAWFEAIKKELVKPYNTESEIMKAEDNKSAVQKELLRINRKAATLWNLDNNYPNKYTRTVTRRKAIELYRVFIGASRSERRSPDFMDTARTHLTMLHLYNDSVLMQKKKYPRTKWMFHLLCRYVALEFEALGPNPDPLKCDVQNLVCALETILSNYFEVDSEIRCKVFIVYIIDTAYRTYKFPKWYMEALVGLALQGTLIPKQLNEIFSGDDDLLCVGDIWLNNELKYLMEIDDFGTDDEDSDTSDQEDSKDFLNSMHRKTRRKDEQFSNKKRIKMRSSSKVAQLQDNDEVILVKDEKISDCDSIKQFDCYGKEKSSIKEENSNVKRNIKPNFSGNKNHSKSTPRNQSKVITIYDDDDDVNEVAHKSDFKSECVDSDVEVIECDDLPVQVKIGRTANRTLDRRKRRIKPKPIYVVDDDEEDQILCSDNSRTSFNSKEDTSARKLGLINSFEISTTTNDGEETLKATSINQQMSASKETNSDHISSTVFIQKKITSRFKTSQFLNDLQSSRSDELNEEEIVTSTKEKSFGVNENDLLREQQDTTSSDSKPNSGIAINSDSICCLTPSTALVNKANNNTLTSMSTTKVKSMIEITSQKEEISSTAVEISQTKTSSNLEVLNDAKITGTLNSTSSNEVKGNSLCGEANNSPSTTTSISNIQIKDSISSSVKPNSIDITTAESEAVLKISSTKVQNLDVLHSTSSSQFPEVSSTQNIANEENVVQSIQIIVPETVDSQIGQSNIEMESVEDCTQFDRDLIQSSETETIRITIEKYGVNPAGSKQSDFESNTLIPQKNMLREIRQEISNKNEYESDLRVLHKKVIEENTFESHSIQEEDIEIKNENIAISVKNRNSLNIDENKIPNIQPNQVQISKGKNSEETYTAPPSIKFPETSFERVKHINAFLRDPIGSIDKPLFENIQHLLMKIEAMPTITSNKPLTVDVTEVEDLRNFYHPKISPLINSVENKIYCNVSNDEAPRSPSKIFESQECVIHQPKEANVSNDEAPISPSKIIESQECVVHQPKEDIPSKNEEFSENLEEIKFNEDTIQPQSLIKTKECKIKNALALEISILPRDLRNDLSNETDDSESISNLEAIQNKASNLVNESRNYESHEMKYQKLTEQNLSGYSKVQSGNNENLQADNCSINASIKLIQSVDTINIENKNVKLNTLDSISGQSRNYEPKFVNISNREHKGNESSSIETSLSSKNLIQSTYTTNTENKYVDINSVDAIIGQSKYYETNSVNTNNDKDKKSFSIDTSIKSKNLIQPIVVNNDDESKSINAIDRRSKDYDSKTVNITHDEFKDKKPCSIEVSIISKNLIESIDTTNAANKDIESNSVDAISKQCIDYNSKIVTTDDEHIDKKSCSMETSIISKNLIKSVDTRIAENKDVESKSVDAINRQSIDCDSKIANTTDDEHEIIKSCSIETSITSKNFIQSVNILNAENENVEAKSVDESNPIHTTNNEHKKKKFCSIETSITSIDLIQSSVENTNVKEDIESKSVDAFSRESKDESTPPIQSVENTNVREEESKSVDAFSRQSKDESTPPIQSVENTNVREEESKSVDAFSRQFKDESTPPIQSVENTNVREKVSKSVNAFSGQSKGESTPPIQSVENTNVKEEESKSADAFSRQSKDESTPPIQSVENTHVKVEKSKSADEFSTQSKDESTPPNKTDNEHKINNSCPKETSITSTVSTKFVDTTNAVIKDPITGETKDRKSEAFDTIDCKDVENENESFNIIIEFISKEQRKIDALISTKSQFQKEANHISESKNQKLSWNKEIEVKEFIKEHEKFSKGICSIQSENKESDKKLENLTVKNKKNEQLKINEDEVHRNGHQMETSSNFGPEALKLKKSTLVPENSNNQENQGQLDTTKLLDFDYTKQYEVNNTKTLESDMSGALDRKLLQADCSSNPVVTQIRLLNSEYGLNQELKKVEDSVLKSNNDQVVTKQNTSVNFKNENNDQDQSNNILSKGILNRIETVNESEMLIPIQYEESVDTKNAHINKLDMIQPEDFTKMADCSKTLTNSLSLVLQRESSSNVDCSKPAVDLAKELIKNEDTKIKHFNDQELVIQGKSVHSIMKNSNIEDLQEVEGKSIVPSQLVESTENKLDTSVFTNTKHSKTQVLTTSHATDGKPKITEESMKIENQILININNQKITDQKQSVNENVKDDLQEIYLLNQNNQRKILNDLVEVDEKSLMFQLANSTDTGENKLNTTSLEDLINKPVNSIIENSNNIEISNEPHSKTQSDKSTFNKILEHVDAKITSQPQNVSSIKTYEMNNCNIPQALKSESLHQNGDFENVSKLEVSVNKEICKNSSPKKIDGNEFDCNKSQKQNISDHFKVSNKKDDPKILLITKNEEKSIDLKSSMLEESVKFSATEKVKLTIQQNSNRIIKYLMNDSKRSKSDKALVLQKDPSHQTKSYKNQLQLTQIEGINIATDRIKNLNKNEDIKLKEDNKQQMNIENGQDFEAKTSHTKKLRDSEKIMEGHCQKTDVNIDKNKSRSFSKDIEIQKKSHKISSGKSKPHNLLDISKSDKLRIDSPKTKDSIKELKDNCDSGTIKSQDKKKPFTLNKVDNGADVSTLSNGTIEIKLKEDGKQNTTATTQTNSSKQQSSNIKLTKDIMAVPDTENIFECKKTSALKPVTSQISMETIDNIQEEKEKNKSNASEHIIPPNNYLGDKRIREKVNMTPNIVAVQTHNRELNEFSVDLKTSLKEKENDSSFIANKTLNNEKSGVAMKNQKNEDEKIAITQLRVDEKIKDKDELFGNDTKAIDNSKDEITSKAGDVLPYRNSFILKDKQEEVEAKLKIGEDIQCHKEKQVQGEKADKDLETTGKRLEVQPSREDQPSSHHREINLSHKSSHSRNKEKPVNTSKNRKRKEDDHKSPSTKSRIDEIDVVNADHHNQENKKGLILSDKIDKATDNLKKEMDKKEAITLKEILSYKCDADLDKKENCEAKIKVVKKIQTDRRKGKKNENQEIIPSLHGSISKEINQSIEPNVEIIKDKNVESPKRQNNVENKSSRTESIVSETIVSVKNHQEVGKMKDIENLKTAAVNSTMKIKDVKEEKVKSQALKEVPTNKNRSAPEGKEENEVKVAEEVQSRKRKTMEEKETKKVREKINKVVEFKSSHVVTPLTQQIKEFKKERCEDNNQSSSTESIVFKTIIPDKDFKCENKRDMENLKPMIAEVSMNKMSTVKEKRDKLKDKALNGNTSKLSLNITKEKDEVKHTSMPTSIEKKVDDKKVQEDTISKKLESEKLKTELKPKVVNSNEIKLNNVEDTQSIKRKCEHENENTSKNKIQFLNAVSELKTESVKEDTPDFLNKLYIEHDSQKKEVIEEKSCRVFSDKKNDEVTSDHSDKINYIDEKEIHCASEITSMEEATLLKKPISQGTEILIMAASDSNCPQKFEKINHSLETFSKPSVSLSSEECGFSNISVNAISAHTADKIDLIIPKTIKDSEYRSKSIEKDNCSTKDRNSASNNDIKLKSLNIQTCAQIDAVKKNIHLHENGISETNQNKTFSIKDAEKGLMNDEMKDMNKVETNMEEQYQKGIAVEDVAKTSNSSLLLDHAVEDLQILNQTNLAIQGIINIKETSMKSNIKNSEDQEVFMAKKQHVDHVECDATKITKGKNKPPKRIHARERPKTFEEIMNSLKDEKFKNKLSEKRIEEECSKIKNRANQEIVTTLQCAISNTEKLIQDRKLEYKLENTNKEEGSKDLNKANGEEIVKMIIQDFNEESENAKQPNVIVEHIPQLFPVLFQQNPLETQQIQIPLTTSAPEKLTQSILPTGSTVDIFESQDATVSVCGDNVLTDLNVSSETDTHPVDVDERPLSEKVKELGSWVTNPVLENQSAVGDPLFYSVSINKEDNKSEGIQEGLEYSLDDNVFLFSEQICSLDNSLPTVEIVSLSNSPVADYQFSDQGTHLSYFIGNHITEDDHNASENMYIPNICKEEIIEHEEEPVNVFSSDNQIRRQFNQPPVVSLEAMNDIFDPVSVVDTMQTQTSSNPLKPKDLEFSMLANIQDKAQEHVFPLTNISLADMDHVNYNEEEPFTTNQLANSNSSELTNLISNESANSKEPQNFKENILQTPRIIPAALENSFIPELLQTEIESSQVHNNSIQEINTPIKSTNKKQVKSPQSAMGKVNLVDIKKLKAENDENDENKWYVRSSVRTRVCAPKRKSPESQKQDTNVKVAATDSKQNVRKRLLSPTKLEVEKKENVKRLKIVSTDNDEEYKTKSKEPLQTPEQLSNLFDSVKQIDPNTLPVLNSLSAPGNSRDISTKKSVNTRKPYAVVKAEKKDNAIRVKIFNEDDDDFEGKPKGRIQTPEELSNLFDSVKKMDLSNLPILNSVSAPGNSREISGNNSRSENKSHSTVKETLRRNKRKTVDTEKVENNVKKDTKKKSRQKEYSVAPEQDMRWHTRSSNNLTADTSHNVKSNPDKHLHHPPGTISRGHTSTSMSSKRVTHLENRYRYDEERGMKTRSQYVTRYGDNKVDSSNYYSAKHGYSNTYYRTN